jgi:hypothetical protein
MAQMTSTFASGALRLSGRAPRATFLPGLALGALAGSVGMALLVAVLACTSGHARAEATLSAGDVTGRLSARGYAVSEPPVRRGSTYLAHGSDKHGQRLRLVMDARNGEIIGLRVIGERRAPRRAASWRAWTERAATASAPQ